MPHRRRVLAALGTACLGSIAGCSTRVPGVENGYLQIKHVSVTWEHRSRRWKDQLLRLYSDGDGRVWGQIAEEARHLVDGVDDVRVDADTHRALGSHFEEVRYGVGFCWTDDGEHQCRNTQASREGFNAVQFGDRATVAFRNPRVYVVDVDTGAQGDAAAWERDVEEFGFWELHEDHGVPLPDRWADRS